MKKQIAFFLNIILISGLSGLYAQYNLLSEGVAITRLEMQGSDGSNGAGVAFNPDLKIYYAAFAGNSTFPLETFKENGVHMDKITTGFDARGFWYNKRTRRIEGNAYNGAGLFGVPINDKGMPIANTVTIRESINMPNEQAAGAFDGKKYIYYNDEGTVYVYDYKKHARKRIFDLSIKNNQDDYTAYTIIYTGVKNMELGMFDYNNFKVVFFNKTSGDITGTVKMPLDFVPEYIFNFAFANNLVWVFDKENRTWVGYKVFN